VQLLDGFGLEFGRCGGGVHDGLPRGVQRLVALLGVSRQPTRTAVAGLLWPDVPEVHAQGSLRSALWRLHKIAPGLIQACRDTLSLADGVQVDVRELSCWAQRVSDPVASVDDLAPARLLLSGELLPGWYDDWVLLERERLRQLRMHALEAWADRLTAAGRFGDAVQAAHVAMQAEPLRESAHRTLIRVHLAEGNIIEAVHAYESFRAMLADELGVVPSSLMGDLVYGLPIPDLAPASVVLDGRLGDTLDRIATPVNSSFLVGEAATDGGLRLISAPGPPERSNEPRSTTRPEGAAIGEPRNTPIRNRS
jgi:DNA-binding SARP family transcriptional activator